MRPRANVAVLVVALIAALTAPRLSLAQDRLLQLRDPAAAGWDAAGLATARATAQRVGSAAVLAVQDGRVVLAWGDVERRFRCHSVRKSILSALIGIAVEQGDIDPSQTLAALGIDDRDPLSAVEKTATVEHLLAARSGIYHPAAKEPPEMKRRRPDRHSRKPGEAFFYNNWDFNVLGVIFAQCTGLSVGEAFTDWLARPLGMADYSGTDATTELEPGNSIHPAYAFRLSARDLARFGMLFAAGGEWQGKQLVPRSWVERSTARRSTFPDGTGYGFMWWIYPQGTLPKLTALNEHDVLAASGTGGQLCLVVPAAGFVFVHRADTDHGRAVRGGAVWDLANRVFAARPRGRAGTARGEVGELRAEPFEGALAAPSVRVAIPVAREVLEEFVGEYEVAGLGRSRVFLHEGRAFVRNPMGQESELACERRDCYFLRSQNVTCRVVRGEDGAITGLELDLHGRKLRGRRVN